MLCTTDLLIRAAVVFRFCQDAIACKDVKELVSLPLCISNRSRQPSDIPRPKFVLHLATIRYSLFLIPVVPIVGIGQSQKKHAHTKKLPGVDRSRHLESDASICICTHTKLLMSMFCNLHTVVVVVCGGDCMYTVFPVCVCVCVYGVL